MVLYWVIFHFILSSYYMLIESMSLPEPCELAYGAALLLSSAGVSLGSILITRVWIGVYYWSVISSLIYTVLFISIIINELYYMGYYVNDSGGGCIYMYLSGLHYVHVLYGIMILGASSTPVHSLGLTPIYTISIDMYCIVDCCYWHMVELVYIYIYILLYYY